MLLYFIRHARAGERDSAQWPDDSQRPLTDDGRKSFRKFLRWLSEARIEPQVVLSSPYTRCRQTTEIFLEQLAEQKQKPTLFYHEELGSGASPDDFIKVIGEQAETDRLAICGHMPDLGFIAGELLGGPALHFSKGAIAAIRCDTLRPGGGELLWLAGPKLAGK
jgi:phosphohistidine phosphatase